MTSWQLPCGRVTHWLVHMATVTPYYPCGSVVATMALQFLTWNNFCCSNQQCRYWCEFGVETISFCCSIANVRDIDGVAAFPPFVKVLMVAIVCSILCTYYNLYGGCCLVFGAARSVHSLGLGHGP